MSDECLSQPNGSDLSNDNNDDDDDDDVKQSEYPSQNKHKGRIESRAREREGGGVLITRAVHMAWQARFTHMAYTPPPRGDQSVVIGEGQSQERKY